MLGKTDRYHLIYSMLVLANVEVHVVQGHKGSISLDDATHLKQRHFGGSDLSAGTVSRNLVFRRWMGKIGAGVHGKLKPCCDEQRCS